MENKENKEKKEKLTFSEWLENVWYYNKWMIIFGGMMIIFVIMSIGQLASGNDPDIKILHVGPMYLSAEAIDRLEDTLEGFSEDYNDDGNFDADLLDITVNKVPDGQGGTVNYDQNNQALTRFQVEIRAGDAVIYALDEEYFKLCLKDNLLTPLEEIIDDVDMPANTVKDEKGVSYGVYISDLDAYSLPGLENMYAGIILCIRRSPEYDGQMYDRTQSDWEGNRKTFVNIIKYRDKNKVKNDIDVLYAGFNDIYSDTVAEFKGVFGEIANKEGDWNFGFKSITLEGNITSIENTSANALAVNEFEEEIFTGETMIYLIDKQLFDICLSEGLLAKFDTVFSESEMPEGVIGGCGIYLYSLDIKGIAGFRNISPNTVVCLRRSPDSETLKYGRLQEDWENNRDIFKDIVSYKSEIIE